MKKFLCAAFIVTVFATSCDSNPNDADGRNAQDTTEKGSLDSTRVFDSTSFSTDSSAKPQDSSNR